MVVKSKKEIEALREGGQILARILGLLAKKIKPGLKTIELDRLAEHEIKKAGAKPSFKGYHSKGEPSYPAAVCVSVNDEVVHAIPSDRVLESGDVVSLDLGVKYKGLFTDSAITVVAGEASGKNQKLISVCREALDVGIVECRAGAHLGDIGQAIQSFVEKNGFRVFKELVGHGVGRKVHEDPQVPNWGKAGEGLKLKEGMVLAIEPMITDGKAQIKLDSDGWTWRTKDGLPAAHFEHTVLVKKGEPLILTVL